MGKKNTTIDNEIILSSPSSVWRIVRDHSSQMTPALAILALRQSAKDILEASRYTYETFEVLPETIRDNPDIQAEAAKMIKDPLFALALLEVMPHPTPKVTAILTDAAYSTQQESTFKPDDQTFKDIVSNVLGDKPPNDRMSFLVEMEKQIDHSQSLVSPMIQQTIQQMGARN